MKQGTDWWPVLLDGALGAFLGTVASVAIALIVIKRQVRHERELARESRRHAACLTLLTEAIEMSRERRSLLRALERAHPDLPNGWDELGMSLVNRGQFALPLAHAVGGLVEPAFTRLNAHLSLLWLQANEPEFADSSVIPVVLRLEENIDDFTGALREHLADSSWDLRLAGQRERRRTRRGSKPS